MKKILALLLSLTMVVCIFAACGKDETNDINAKSEGVMTYAEYDAAALDTEVVIEAYVQGFQGWWFDDSVGHGKITLYLQDADGGYFAYEVNCDEETAGKITKGTKVKVTGYKGAWEGEVEIMDGTLEIGEGTWVAEATDVTALLANEDELIKHQNKFVSFKGLTVDSIEYKNGTPGNDIYVTVSLDGNAYSFCVESYLTGPDTEVYAAIGALNAGDVVDIEGFLYWYQGVNTHITSVKTAG